MTTVLSVDSAGPVVGACLLDDGGEHEWSERVRRGADTALIPAIADLLVRVEALDLVAVTVGPGAFTGLRVGVAAALGVAVSCDVPVVCVSSLEARASLHSGESVLALLDARKSRVYAQWFDCSGPIPVARNEPVDAPLDSVLPNVPFVAVGEGALLQPDLIEAMGGRLGADPARSAAPAVGRLARLRASSAMAPNAVALAYLRDADAKKPARN